MTGNSKNMNAQQNYARVLTIAGSDSGGGAGIQADLKTFSALGCYGMSVITALTAQNTTGVTGIHAVPPSFVAQQIAAVMDDIGVDAVKIGMLFSAELIESVAESLKRYGVNTIVLDPVMVAQSGDKLLQDEAIEALKETLIPLATIITPNLPEAEVLLYRDIDDEEGIHKAASSLAAIGSKSVLIKGGHLDTSESSDVLYIKNGERFVVLPDERVQTPNIHGTGCTLSSAIAAQLAKGLEIEPAVRKAKEYIAKAIRAGARYRIGQGSGPVHHFHEFWE